MRVVLIAVIGFTVLGCVTKSVRDLETIESVPSEELFNSSVDVKQKLSDEFDKPGAIGFYSSGCIAGAEALPIGHYSYAIANKSRRRYYGHPELIEYIQELSQKVYEKRLGKLIIGDMAKFSGGPMPKTHASHQTGLDVDVWYQRVESKRNFASQGVDLESAPPAYVGVDGRLRKDLWSLKDEEVIRLAAESDNVSRIFVNVRIKQKICQTFKGQSWLSKIRPWYGHDDHFHVRLNCPKEDSFCKPQAPVNPELGCENEVISAWYSREKRDRRRVSHTQRVFKGRLPQLCSTAVSADSQSM